MGAPFVVAVLVGLAAGALVSVATELLAYRWVRSNPAAAPAVALGLLLILQNTALRLWSGEGKALDTPYQSALLRVGGVSLSGVKLALIVVAAVSLGALGLVLARTSLGRAVRAVAQDREAAAMLGIPVQQQYTLAFLIAGLLGGVSAIAYAPTFQISPYMADEVLLSAFVVVVIGGLGSIAGAVVGGLVLGIVESLGAYYLSSAYQSAFGFIALVVILVAAARRPARCQRQEGRLMPAVVRGTAAVDGRPGRARARGLPAPHDAGGAPRARSARW